MTLAPLSASRRVVLVAAASTLAGIRTARAQVTTLAGGTGAATRLIARLAQECADLHGSRIEVVPSLGSAGGLRALAANRIHVAVTLNGPGDPGHGFWSFPLGRSPIVFVSHPGVPRFDLDPEAMARLLVGEERRWPDGTPVRVVHRPPSEREWHALRDGPPALRRVPGAALREGDLVASNSQDNARLLGSLTGSLGLMSRSQIAAEELDLTEHSLSGATGGLDALRSGAWPFGITIHVVYRPDAPERVRHFMNFLRDTHAQDLLPRWGVLPMERGA
jgi:phosphate transport system substrate-binding protein